MVLAMVLYTCTDGKILGDLPAAIAHPCGRAAKALDDAGHAYEWKKVKGGRLKFWTWPARGRDRAEVERLSGQRAVPILVLDDGKVITGSAAIVRWAQANPPQTPSAVA
jgi:glutathione S-transferase